MRYAFILLAVPIVLSACSETTIEDQSEEELTEIEKQVEAEAKSLEEAAAESVRVLEAEIQAELEDDGIGEPQAPPTRAPDEDVE